MTLPTVSVIVPVYNAERSVERCIRSIAAQQYRPLEILAVDDGSRDATASLLEGLAREIPELRVIHKENGGVSSARNAALDSMRGSFVVFVDADDWIAPDMISELLRLREKRQVACVVSSVIMEYPDGRQDRLRYTELSCADTGSALEEYVRRGWGHLHGRLYPAAALRDLRFDPALVYCEDLLFNFRALERLPSCHFTGQSFYHYVQNAGSAFDNINIPFGAPFNPQSLQQLVVWDALVRDCPLSARAIAARQRYLVVIQLLHMLLRSRTEDPALYERLRQELRKGFAANMPGLGRKQQLKALLYCAPYALSRFCYQYLFRGMLLRTTRKHF